MSDGGQARRFSSVVLIAIVIVLALSLIALYDAFAFFVDNDPSNDFLIGFFLLIGFVGLALSTYMLFQARRRIRRFTLETPPVVTAIVCSKCGFKNVRNFERGDYILKELEPCTKCQGPTTISAIYREIKEKRKEEKVFT